MLQNLLKKYNIRPSKRLGQNFLIDSSVLAKIVAAADLSPNDIVLEVGPGLGILTLALAQRVKKIIAVEKDKKMAKILKNVLSDKNVKNVEIVEGDILKTQSSKLLNRKAITRSEAIGWKAQNHSLKLKTKKYKIVANIPYYLTSPLIRKFLETNNQPQSMVLMVQKEVAQRICSKPPKMTLLSVAAQFYAKTEIVSYVSKNSFWPKPKVNSAIIKISPITQKFTAEHQQIKDFPRGSAHSSAWFRDKFFELVKASFSQPRKQLINNLSRGLNLSREKTSQILSQANLSPFARPGELSVEKYMELTWIICGKKGII